MDLTDALSMPKAAVSSNMKDYRKSIENGMNLGDATRKCELS